MEPVLQRRIDVARISVQDCWPIQCAKTIGKLLGTMPVVDPQKGINVFSEGDPRSVDVLKWNGEDLRGVKLPKPILVGIGRLAKAYRFEVSGKRKSRGNHRQKRWHVKRGLLSKSPNSIRAQPLSWA